MRRTRDGFVAALGAIAIAWAATAPVRAHRREGLSSAALRALRLQVLLDRSGYSPGEIDAAEGPNTRRALDAFTSHGGNAEALPRDAVSTYTISESDASTTFTPDIPSDLEAQAGLESLDYRNIVEMLGERFHASPDLLRTMNPGARFSAGESIQVPNVLDGVRPVADARGGSQDASGDPAALTVTVSRSASTLTVTDNAGHVLFFAPVTTGSEHDPLPIGDWKVTGVQRDPTFHYNPDLFWDADPSHPKAVIPPGPNNPVGVVWIDINKPHYGLHGTPEPSEIGKVQSHGCVRLTNWDAMKVASLVRTGTPVRFVP
jgi:lipoprotein-anchoring transpeptidase ErfK/SrfK